LNRHGVLERVRQYGVVPLKADKSQEAPEVDELLVELGNLGRGIPYYAIFPADGGAPITFDGLVTQQTILDALERAGPSRGYPKQDADTTQAAAR
jgi:thiol:disulfide interchange protein